MGLRPQAEIFHLERNLFRLRGELRTTRAIVARRGSEGDKQTMHSKIQTTLALHALRALLGLVLCALALAVVLVFTVVGHATQPFEDQSFKQAQAAGKTILVDVTASWCPTCRQQRPIVEQIEKEKPNLVVYEVDFDTAKDTLK